MKTCCCAGHRPNDFTFLYGIDLKKHFAYLYELQKIIELAITEYGITNFITGMTVGVDLDFAKAVLVMKNAYQVTLECAIPHPNHTLKWNKFDKLSYDSILNRADKISIISEKYSPDCMFKRNRYMVDNSELVIAVFKEKSGTCHTLNYANKTNKKVEFIYLK